MRILHFRLGLYFVIQTLPSDVQAGAWTLPAGQGQAVVTGTLSSGTATTTFQSAAVESIGLGNGD